MSRGRGYDEQTWLYGRIAKLIAAVLILAIAGGVAFSTTVVEVDVEEVALMVNPINGEVTLGPTGPIWRPFAKAPWVEVVPIPLYTQAVLMSEGSPQLQQEIARRVVTDRPIEVLSKDGLLIATDLNIRYRILASKSVELYKRYPKLDYYVQIVQISRAAVRDIISKFTATEIIEKRETLAEPIKQEITEKIQGDPSLVGAIEIVGIEILKILPPRQFLNAVEEKLTAQQRALAAQFERERLLIQADAERQAEIIRATGLAQAKIISANATRQSIELVTKALGGGSEQASMLYLQLLMYREIASSSPNTIFIIGQAADGQLFLIPLDRIGQLQQGLGEE